MRSGYTPIAIVALLIGVVACGVLQKKDSETEVRTFLMSFQNNLAKSDDEILKQFDTQQSSESILTAIHILQNKEHVYLECKIDFAQAQLTIGETAVNIVIPAQFKSVNLDRDYHAESSLSMTLRPKDGTYVISKLEAEAFYKSFADLKIDMEYSVEQMQALKTREPIFEQAKHLQQKFDSVIWYTTYNDKRYFYVIAGTWDSSLEVKHDGANYKMGLTDEDGNIIIPLEYDLIGCLGFAYPNMVEVKKNGKLGYYDLNSKKLVVATSYDMIIPYQEGSAFAILKNDTTYGWVNRAFEHQQGFPSPAAAAWVNSFSFIPANLKFKGDSLYAFCEIPNEPHIGYGILVPPSYLVKSGLFNEVITGISTTSFPYAGWTAYMETKGTKLQTISDKISAMMTTITERYIEGREEFYTYNRMVFIDSRHDTLEVNNVSAAGEINFRKPDSTLLEISYLNSYYSMEGSSWPESNMLSYEYFELGPNLSVKHLSTHRDFPFTQFVKMDSSYLQGDFSGYDYELEKEVKSTFISSSTLEYMREEILADYGFIFPDENTNERYKGRDWYKPRYESIEAFRDDMTDIDRYNLDFLDKILALAQKPV
jgi:hypothetical protein